MYEPKTEILASITRARAELDQALDDLGRLPAFEIGTVAYAAHTLVNYLAVADATIELCLDRLPSDIDADVRAGLEALQRTTNAMTRTVAHLMNASASAEPDLRFARVNMVRMATLACEYYQRTAARKRISLTFEPTVDSAHVWSDNVAVAAVVDNLISNAVKYSPPGRRVWLRVAVEPESVVFSVQDEGPGLSPEDQAKLFQKGVRLSAVPTGGELSTAYGLAVCKDLIDRLGGEIWCESQLGIGATFSIRLPTQGPQA
jgi:signal transduction histidine kinase